MMSNPDAASTRASGSVGHGLSQFLSPYSDRRPWGRLDLPDPLHIARTGIARYRISVYAPGTSDLERRELRLAGRWWLGTATFGLAVEVLVAAIAGGVPAALFVALTGAAICFYWLARTRTIRRSTRTLRIAVVRTGGSHEVIGDAALFGECRRQLALLDGEPTSPHLTPLQSETIWAEVYERLDPTVRTAATPGCRR